MTGDRIRKAGGRVLSPEMREVVLMKIYCMSDIHGCIAEFEYALSLVEEQLSKPDTRLVVWATMYTVRTAMRCLIRS